MLTIFRNLFAPPRHLILLVVAVWIGIALSEKRAEQHGINKEHISNITFYSLIAFIIGGRISFVIQNIPIFLKSPLDIVSLNTDVFDIIGAIAAAMIVGLIYGQRCEMPFWSTLDALTPLFAILVVGLGLSHLAAGTSFGSETDLPWGINLWNATRHPTQIYETLASLLIFSLIWFKKHVPRSGILFLMFAAFTAGSQLFIQAFRGDSTLIFNGFRQNQIIAWAILIIIFILFELRLKEKQS